MKWEADIAIEPRAKQSTTFTGKTKTGKPRAYTVAKKTQYQQAIQLYAMEHKPDALLQGPLRLDVLFMWPWPKSFPKKRRGNWGNFKPTKPDLDNLLKPVKDALRGVVYRDDAQIAAYGAVQKAYGRQARVWITVREIAEPLVDSTRPKPEQKVLFCAEPGD